MTTPRYLIAKYIPEPGRMEPRNIGVVVWSPSGLEARFLAENPLRPSTVDRRRIPSFVTSSEAYARWVAFWRAELARPEIASSRGRDKIARTSPGFLDALRDTGRGNFVLAEGGYLLDLVPAAELGRLADRLFASLVETAGVAGPRDRSLDALVEGLIREAQLLENPHFRRRHPVACPVAPGVVERYEFSYAYQNGSLRRLYQCVSLPGKASALRRGIHDAAWMFEKVIRARLIQAEQGAVLVHADAVQRARPEVLRSLEVIRSVTRVLDLSDPKQARAEFLELGAT